MKNVLDYGLSYKHMVCSIIFLFDDFFLFACAILPFFANFILIWQNFQGFSEIIVMKRTKSIMNPVI